MIMSPGPIAGRLADRIGARLPIVCGALFLTASLVWMSFSTQTSAYGSCWCRSC